MSKRKRQDGEFEVNKKRKSGVFSKEQWSTSDFKVLPVKNIVQHHNDLSGNIFLYPEIPSNIFLVYDLETTGTDPLSARVVQVAAMAFSIHPFRIHYYFQQLVFQKSVPAASTNIHGIREIDVRNSHKLDKIMENWKTIQNCLLQYFRTIDSKKSTKFVLCGYNNFRYDDIVLWKQYENLISFLDESQITFFADVFASGSRQCAKFLTETLELKVENKKLTSLFRTYFKFNNNGNFHSYFEFSHIFPEHTWMYIRTIMQFQFPSLNNTQNTEPLIDFLLEQAHEALVDIYMTMLLMITAFFPDNMCMQGIGLPLKISSFTQWETMLKEKTKSHKTEFSSFPKSSYIFEIAETEVIELNNCISSIVNSINNLEI